MLGEPTIADSVSDLRARAPRRTLLQLDETEANFADCLLPDNIRVLHCALLEIVLSGFFYPLGRVKQKCWHVSFLSFGFHFRFASTRSF